MYKKLSNSAQVIYVKWERIGPKIEPYTSGFADISHRCVVVVEKLATYIVGIAVFNSLTDRKR